MPNNRFLFLDLHLDGESSYVFPTEHIVFGSLAVHQVFSHISKFAGALLLSIASGSNSISQNNVSGNSHSRHRVTGFRFCSGSTAIFNSPALFATSMNSTMRHVLKEVDNHIRTSFPVLSLAASLVPPLNNLSFEVNAIPETAKVEMNGGGKDQRPCIIENRESANLSFQEIPREGNAVEPKTGMEFPTALQNVFTDAHNSDCLSEVLVGTGYRSMRIVMFKSIKGLAFGLCEHFFSCYNLENFHFLGPKYANVPIDELSDRQDFLQDLVKDIDMSVRLVVNCRGMRINAVRDALEKPLVLDYLRYASSIFCSTPTTSISKRSPTLVFSQKMNPGTDYHCLKTFRSCFPRNTSLPMGTTIDVRRTMDGQLITNLIAWNAVDGKYIGAVPSKDLCMAFFDMYIGDVPVSMQARDL
ncbi:hypothetical protein MKX03_014169 [Papaver bracteatum]|nr:hypothetical protein MKX03_014169 [Papaver bracteatum]